MLNWQIANEVEDDHENETRTAVKLAPHRAPAAFRRIRFDTAVGMPFFNLGAFFIILTGAVPCTPTARPTSPPLPRPRRRCGPSRGASRSYSFVLFAAGIISTNLLALPVLAGARTYATAGAWHKTYGWHASRVRCAFSRRF